MAEATHSPSPHIICSINHFKTHPEMPITMAGLKAPSLIISQFSLVARSNDSSRWSCVYIGSLLNRRQFRMGCDMSVGHPNFIREFIPYLL